MDCEVMTIQALYFMALSIKLFANIGVTPDVKFFGIFDADAVLHFRKFIHHMDATKSSTYFV